MGSDARGRGVRSKRGRPSPDRLRRLSARRARPRRARVAPGRGLDARGARLRRPLPARSPSHSCPASRTTGYRYVWDGLLQVEGINPYAFRPVRPGAEQRGRADPLFDRLNSAELLLGSIRPPRRACSGLGGVVRVARPGGIVIKAVFVEHRASRGMGAEPARSGACARAVCVAPARRRRGGGAGAHRGGDGGGAAPRGVGVPAGEVRGPVGGGADRGGLVQADPVRARAVPAAARRVAVGGEWGRSRSRSSCSRPYAALFALGHVAESLGLYVRACSSSTRGPTWG